MDHSFQQHVSRHEQVLRSLMISSFWVARNRKLYLQMSEVGFMKDGLIRAGCAQRGPVSPSAIPWLQGRFIPVATVSLQVVELTAPTPTACATFLFLSTRFFFFDCALAREIWLPEELVSSRMIFPYELTNLRFL